MVVGGFDLSLTATGMVAVPERWGGGVRQEDWSRIAVAKAGHGLRKDAPERERVARLEDIETAILAFVAEQKVKVAVIEQYAFTSMLSHAHALGELGGVVKVALQRAGVEIAVVSPASARKCLGKQPRAQAKVWAQQRLYRAGAPKSWTEDQLDAFVIANHHLAENGGDAVIIPEAAA